MSAKFRVGQVVSHSDYPLSEFRIVGVYARYDGGYFYQLIIHDSHGTMFRSKFFNIYHPEGKLKRWN